MEAPRRAADPATEDAALDFVRFCYRRRRVGWPELYDEMCAVASRGVYKGWGFGELAEHGIGFGLSEMPRLAGIVARIGQEEGERRGRLLAGVMARVPARPEAGDGGPSGDEIGRRVLVSAAR